MDNDGQLLSQDEESHGFNLETGKTWIYPTNYPIRDYQYNIVSKALFDNTMVCLPTGLGKTFIAAVVMYNYFRWYPHGKIIFMAPTKPLVKQQVEACYNIMAIPKEATAELTGTTAQSSRDEIWEQKRVFFITPQVLQNDLERIARLGRQIKCLVFDEAHKARGNFAYCEVIKKIFPISRHFRVLALTATPGSNVSDVVKVCSDLLISHLEIRTEDSEDVAKFVFKRNIQTIVVPFDPKLKQVMDDYSLVLDRFVRVLVNNRVIQGNCNSITKGRMFYIKKEYEEKNRYTRGPQHNEIMKTLNVCLILYHAHEVLTKHGLRGFVTFFKDHEDKPLLRNIGEIGGIVDDVSNYLGEIPDVDMLPDGTVPEIPKDTKFGHPKFYKLAEVLTSHFNKLHSTGQPGRVIVFCEYRESVMEAYTILLMYRPLVKPRIFLGQTTITQKQQLNVLQSFRSGNCNTLISTSIGEEGLDIGDVNLVVCFDISSKSSIRMIQRMGRTGRKREGNVIMLVTEGKEQQLLRDCLAHKDYMATAMKTSTELRKSLYKNSAKMIPEGLTPVCDKIFITVEKDTKNGNLLGMFKNMKKSGFNYENVEVLDFTDRIPKRSFLLNKNVEEVFAPEASGIQVYSVETNRVLQSSLGEIGSSSQSKILVSLLQFADSLRYNISSSQSSAMNKQQTKSEKFKQSDIRSLFQKQTLSQMEFQETINIITKNEQSSEHKELQMELNNYLSQLNFDCKICNNLFPCNVYKLDTDLEPWILPEMSIVDSLTKDSLENFIEGLKLEKAVFDEDLIKEFGGDDFEGDEFDFSKKFDVSANNNFGIDLDENVDHFPVNQSNNESFESNKFGLNNNKDDKFDMINNKNDKFDLIKNEDDKFDSVKNKDDKFDLVKNVDDLIKNDVDEINKFNFIKNNSNFEQFDPRNDGEINDMDFPLTPNIVYDFHLPKSAKKILDNYNSEENKEKKCKTILPEKGEKTKNEKRQDVLEFFKIKDLSEIFDCDSDIPNKESKKNESSDIKSKFPNGQFQSEVELINQDLPEIKTKEELWNSEPSSKKSQSANEQTPNKKSRNRIIVNSPDIFESMSGEDSNHSEPKINEDEISAHSVGINKEEFSGCNAGAEAKINNKMEHISSETDQLKRGLNDKNTSNILNKARSKLNFANKTIGDMESKNKMASKIKEQSNKTISIRDVCGDDFLDLINFDTEEKSDSRESANNKNTTKIEKLTKTEKPIARKVVGNSRNFDCNVNILEENCEEAKGGFNLKRKFGDDKKINASSFNFEEKKAKTSGGNVVGKQNATFDLNDFFGDDFADLTKPLVENDAKRRKLSCEENRHFNNREDIMKKQNDNTFNFVKPAEVNKISTLSKTSYKNSKDSGSVYSSNIERDKNREDSSNIKGDKTKLNKLIPDVNSISNAGISKGVVKKNAQQKVESLNYEDVFDNDFFGLATQKTVEEDDFFALATQKSTGETDISPKSNKEINMFASPIQRTPEKIEDISKVKFNEEINAFDGGEDIFAMSTQKSVLPKLVEDNVTTGKSFVNKQSRKNYSNVNVLKSSNDVDKKITYDDELFDISTQQLFKESELFDTKKSDKVKKDCLKLQKSSPVNKSKKESVAIKKVTSTCTENKNLDQKMNQDKSVNLDDDLFDLQTQKSMEEYDIFDLETQRSLNALNNRLKSSQQQESPQKSSSKPISENLFDLPTQKSIPDYSLFNSTHEYRKNSPRKNNPSPSKSFKEINSDDDLFGDEDFSLERSGVISKANSMTPIREKESSDSDATVVITPETLLIFENMKMKGNSQDDEDDDFQSSPDYCTFNLSSKRNKLEKSRKKIFNNSNSVVGNHCESKGKEGVKKTVAGLKSDVSGKTKVNNGKSDGGIEKLGLKSDVSGKTRANNGKSDGGIEIADKKILDIKNGNVLREVEKKVWEKRRSDEDFETQDTRVKKSTNCERKENLDNKPRLGKLLETKRKFNDSGIDDIMRKYNTTPTKNKPSFISMSNNSSPYAKNLSPVLGQSQEEIGELSPIFSKRRETEMSPVLNHSQPVLKKTQVNPLKLSPIINISQRRVTKSPKSQKKTFPVSPISNQISHYFSPKNLESQKRSRLESPESPVINVRQKRLRVETDSPHLPSNQLGEVIELSSDDDFEESPVRKPKAHHRNKRNLGGFLEVEAALGSDEEASEDEESGSSLDVMEASFVNDDTQDFANTTVMHTHYLQTARSPIRRKGGFKIPNLPKTIDRDIFSQAVPNEDNTYVEDSFCVDSEDEPESTHEFSELEIAERILKQKKQQKKMRAEDCGVKKRRRRILIDTSSDSD